MSSLLSKLSGVSKSAIIEPREIFMSLPRKDKKYPYPRDVQTEVWKKWFSERNNKNNIIKMNTGSGKTVVGLMILQSCLNEGKGPAVYIVPDNYLVEQVKTTAQDLGISVTTEKNDYLFLNSKAILITNIYTLVNGLSSFGMKPSGNIPIGSIVIDDVHSCIDTITTQYSINIPYTHKLYKEIMDILSEPWKAYNNTAFTDIVTNNDPTKSEMIPFWIWQDKQNEIYSLLSKYNNNEEDNNSIYFNLPLISDSLKTCDCIVSSKKIEIIPEGISISHITSFENASRRIFMSATLSDDSVFVSSMGIYEDEINMIISPDNANDIGDRLIVFPRHLNHEISNTQIKEKVLSYTSKYNVVVIVPSNEKAKFWDETGNRIISSECIETEVNKLKSGHVGLTIFVNRYDGIDLPDDACRILVLDGLPPLNSTKDNYIQRIDSESNILRRKQIQKIEQGMGRGVRSNTDYCCVVLMGDSLSNVLINNSSVDYFSKATRAQYDLSKELWDLLIDENRKPTVDDVFELLDFSLNREIDWINKSKQRLFDIHYYDKPKFDDNIVALRKAFDYSIKLQFENSINTLDASINLEHFPSTKGFLMQIKAKYINMIDKHKAQEILLSGRKYNNYILPPINGIRYDKAVYKTDQANNIIELISNKKIKQNDFVIYMNGITSSLVFSTKFDEFEEALMKLGIALGFESTCPDKETNGKGTDNLWIIENELYLVIECKNEAEVDFISKDYCNQLAGSIRWFKEEYKSSNSIPVMIHKSTKIDSLATAVENMRVINQEKLELLNKAANEFAVAMSQDDIWNNPVKITKLLKEYKLSGNELLKNFSIKI